MLRIAVSSVVASLVVGCGKKEPAALTASPSGPSITTESPTSTASTRGVAQSTGEAVFQRTCRACHGVGIAGAPKLGDLAAWQPRVAQGIDVLHRHAITGFTGATGVMPPKGGFTNLSDDEVRAAVDYMVDQAK